MTTVLLYKGIRDDQTEVKQRMAGRFYSDGREDAGNYGSVVGTCVVTFLSLYESGYPVWLAREWGISKSLIRVYLTRRNRLLRLGRATDNHYQWTDYHACCYILDVPIAYEARQRGYDGIHYSVWGTYVKL